MTNQNEALEKLRRPVRHVLVFAATTALRQKSSLSLPDLHEQFCRWRDHEFGRRYVDYCFKKIAEQDLMTVEGDQVTFTELGLKTALYALELATENVAGFENILPNRQRPEPQATVSTMSNQMLASPLLTIAPLATRPGIQSFD